MAGVQERTSGDHHKRGGGSCISIDIHYGSRESLEHTAQISHECTTPVKRISSTMRPTTQGIETVSDDGSVDDFDGLNEDDRRASLQERSEREKDIALWESFSDIVPMSHLQCAQNEFDLVEHLRANDDKCGSTTHEEVPWTDVEMCGVDSDYAPCCAPGPWKVVDSTEESATKPVENIAADCRVMDPATPLQEKSLNRLGTEVDLELVDDLQKAAINHGKPPRFSVKYNVSDPGPGRLNTSGSLEEVSLPEGFHSMTTVQNCQHQCNPMTSSMAESSSTEQSSSSGEDEPRRVLEQKQEAHRSDLPQRAKSAGAKSQERRLEGSTESFQDKRAKRRTQQKLSDKPPTSPGRQHHAEAEQQWTECLLDSNMSGLGQERKQHEERAANLSSRAPGALMATTDSIFASRDSIFGSMYDIVIPPSPLDAAQLQAQAEHSNEFSEGRCVSCTNCVAIGESVTKSLKWLSFGLLCARDVPEQRFQRSNTGSSDASQFAANQRARDIYRRRQAVLLNKMQAVLDDKEVKRKRRSFQFLYPMRKNKDGSRKSKETTVKWKEENPAYSESSKRNVFSAVDLDSANHGGVLAGQRQSVEEKKTTGSRYFPNPNVVKFIKDQHLSGKFAVAST